MLLAQIPCLSRLMVMGPLPGTSLSPWAGGPCWALRWDPLSPAGKGTAVLIFARDYFLLGSFSLGAETWGLYKALARERCFRIRSTEHCLFYEVWDFSVR